MTDERSYPAGVPCWVDTEQPDAAAPRHFYASLFGWSFTDAVPPDAPGTYLIASLEGKDVAAVGLDTGTRRSSGTPTSLSRTPISPRPLYVRQAAASRSNRSTQSPAAG